MFVVSLVGVSSTEQESIYGITSFRDVTRIVIVHLVVIPGDDERHRGMDCLEIGIRFVQTVAISIILQCFNLTVGVHAHTILVSLVFINVVAEMEYDVEIFLDHMSKCGEVALFVVVTGAESKPKPIVDGRWFGRCSGSSDLAVFTA